MTTSIFFSSFGLEKGHGSILNTKNKTFIGLFHKKSGGLSLEDMEFPGVRNNIAQNNLKCKA